MMIIMDGAAKAGVVDTMAEEAGKAGSGVMAESMVMAENMVVVAMAMARNTVDIDGKSWWQGYHDKKAVYAS